MAISNHPLQTVLFLQYFENFFNLLFDQCCMNFQGTYEYGCQLVNVALSLRQSCKLPIDTNTALSHDLWRTWKQLYSAGQEQMTRLRVSAVFHRSVHQVGTINDLGSREYFKVTVLMITVSTEII